MSVTILLLAAGASSRMEGADKLALEIDGEPLLHRSTRAALESGVAVVVVTTPAREPLIADLPVTIRHGGRNMSDSLRIGLDGMDTDVIISLADMPDITAEHYHTLIAAHKTAPICRMVTETNEPGHPVLFDRRYLGELTTISGDVGPKSVLARHSDDIALVRSDGQAAITDLDTPADWEKYQK